MKKMIMLSSWLMFFVLLNPSCLLAQPTNDAPCDAITITIDAPPFIISNANATSPDSEEAIVPPNGSFDEFGNCVGGWCDGSGMGGGSGVDHSVWFKFTAPVANKGVLINLCASTFDSQVALYSVGDCSDYGTFNYIYSSDDQAGCGNFPDANNDGLAEVGLASTILIACLNPGEEYYILVDAWQNTSLSGFIEGDVVLEIEELDDPNPNGVVLSTPDIVHPICPGEARGSIDNSLLAGISPISYIWSNGSTTQDLIDIPAGNYSLTVTDFCGNSEEFNYELVDADPEPISIINTDNFSIDNTFTQPFNCVRQGQINLPVFTGIPPFSYQWEHGPTTAVLDSLEDGIYTVTISDGCQLSNSTIELEFEVVTETPDDIPNAGPDINLSGSCISTPIGFDNPYNGEQGLRITSNTDQERAGGNIHCRFDDPNDDPPTDGSISESTHWRSFDLSTFDIPDGAKLKGMEIFVNCAANTLADGIQVDYQPGLPMSFTLHYANTTALDDPNLNLILVDSVTTYIPTTNGYTPYFIPFPNAGGVHKQETIAVTMQTRGDFGIGHFFNIASNETASPGAVTYLSGCNLGDSPIALENLFGPNDGFPDETIVNLIFSKPGEYTYTWEGDVDDPSSATPMALKTSGINTYDVTITDPCGVETIDAVEVVCFGSDSTDDLVEASFSITPNPSTGTFQMINEGASREMLVEVFDLAGKMVHHELMNIGNGASAVLDLTGLAKGTYLAKLSNDKAVETHRLVIQ